MQTGIFAPPPLYKIGLKFVIFKIFLILNFLQKGQTLIWKSLWQSFKNQKSELTVLLHFLSASSWSSFFPRNFKLRFRQHWHGWIYVCMILWCKFASQGGGNHPPSFYLDWFGSVWFSLINHWNITKKEKVFCCFHFNSLSLSRSWTLYLYSV